MQSDLIVDGGALSVAEAYSTALPALIARATKSLASATSAAEVLEAKDFAAGAYDAAKRMARLAKAKSAHDEVIAAVYRAQADALLIESQAKARLADEYDAAQASGDAAKRGRPTKRFSKGTFFTGHEGEDSRQRIEAAAREAVGMSPAKIAEVAGLSKKQIHEARRIRDAEKAQPGAVEQALNERLAKGEEPTRAALKRDLHGTARQAKETAREEAQKVQKETLDQLRPDTRAARDRAADFAAGPKANRADEVDALKAELAEKNEYIAAVETDLADARRQIAKYDDMVVQYERGGFEQVIAGKDEEIRVLETRLFTESADKASWMKMAKAREKTIAFYKGEAERRGYSDDIDVDDIDPETGEIING
jgi:hypothetical protein